MNGYKFLTNFRIQEYDVHVAEANEANEILGKKAISVSKKAYDNGGNIIEGSGSVWYKCNHEELQVYHEIVEKREKHRFAE